MTLFASASLACLFLLVQVQLWPLSSGKDIAASKNQIFTTCDFDLEDIEQLLPHLPAICSEIYEKRLTDSDLYNRHLEESQAFGKFAKKLNEYEVKKQTPVVDEYPFDKQLRMQIYSQANWADCVINQTKAEDYLNCVTQKREELLLLVPETLK